MRLADLPADDRRQVVAALAGKAGPRRRRVGSAAASAGATPRSDACGAVTEPRNRTRPDRYRCHTCGATFTAWAPAQRHADTHHGARIDLVRLQ